MRGSDGPFEPDGIGLLAMLPRNALQVLQDALDACPFGLEEVANGSGQRVRAPEANLSMEAGAHPGPAADAIPSISTILLYFLLVSPLAGYDVA